MKIFIGNGRMSREINFPCADAELQNALLDIEIEDVVPYGKMKSIEEPLSGLEHFIGKPVNLDELNYYVKRWESLMVYQKKKISACVQAGEFTTLKDMINLTFHENGYHLIEDFKDMKAVGMRIFMDKYGGITEEDKKQWNFEAFAEDAMKDCKAAVTRFGVLLDGGGVMEQTYNGKTFPEYLYDPDTSVMSVEIENAKGKCDYLYLPTDIVSVEKLKARLGVDFISECKIRDTGNSRLPEELYQRIHKIESMKDLTAVNEFCSKAVRLNEQQLEQLSLIAKFVKTNMPEQLTALAGKLDYFEVVKDIHNLEEYGKYLINESGLFIVDELIQPFINYEEFAREKVESMYSKSEFMEDGFVGSELDLSDILSYKGEFAELLEIPETDYEILRLYSPLTADLYEVDEYGDTSMDAQQLSAGELVECQEQILEAIKREACPGEEARGMMHYFDEDRAVAGKVLDARPTVEEYNGKLYGVLECRIREPLTPEELNKLTCFWNGQESDGWGEGFEQRDIEVEGGRLNVHFWNTGNYAIMTEMELKGGVQNQSEVSQIQM